MATDTSVEFAFEEAKEGIEILDNLISNIEEHGNYSVESTLGFLNAARGCFKALETLAKEHDEYADGAQSR